MFNSLKIKIILTVISILFVCITAYLYVDTEINQRLYHTNTERETISKVTFSVDKINYYTDTMEKKSTELARAGEIFYKTRTNLIRSDLDASVKAYLIDSFSLFPEAIGGGLWYEPYVFYTDQKYYGPYAYWDNGAVLFTWDLNTSEYDYHTQDWYTLAIPSEWNRSQKRERKYYWTHPYIDEAGSLEPMITVDTFMYDEHNAIIGIATVDWSTKGMVTFLESIKISEAYEFLLVDTEGDHIIANTLDSESVMKEKETVPWIAQITDVERGIVKTKTFDIEGISYYAYYTLSDLGMLFVTLVPVSQVTKSSIELNIFTILGAYFFSGILILLLYWSLLKITRPIIEITNALYAVTHGDMSTRLHIHAKDEIGLLASGFNQMTDTLEFQKKELESNNKKLEAKVIERTTEVNQKNQELGAKIIELERLNKIMINRELKMVELKKQIAELTQK